MAGRKAQKSSTGMMECSAQSGGAERGCWGWSRYHERTRLDDEVACRPVELTHEMIAESRGHLDPEGTQAGAG